MIYQKNEIKVPVLTEVDPLALPRQLRDFVKHDKNSTLYTARGKDGRIILFNPAKRKLVITSLENFSIAKDQNSKQKNQAHI